MVMMLLIPMVVWDYVFHTYDDDDVVLWWWWNEEVGDLIPYTRDDDDIMLMKYIYLYIYDSMI